MRGIDTQGVKHGARFSEKWQIWHIIPQIWWMIWRHFPISSQMQKTHLIGIIFIVSGRLSASAHTTAMECRFARRDEPVQVSQGVEESNIDEKYYEPPLMQVIASACNACPENQYEVTDKCMGCACPSV